MGMDAYWKKQVEKHEKSAASLLRKYVATGEVRWLRQAKTNEESAKKIKVKYG
jgi:hypothetical protein